MAILKKKTEIPTFVRLLSKKNQPKKYKVNIYTLSYKRMEG